MKRFNVLLVATVIGVSAAACGDGGQQNNMGNMPMPAPAPAASASGDVDVTLTTTPNPPVIGENTFEVMVMSGGQPVTDGEVSVEFFMAAMPEMKMAEMRNTVALKHEGGGRYRGTGNVMMAGNWDATVMVMRGGQAIGSEKLTVTAK